MAFHHGRCSIILFLLTLVGVLPLPFWGQDFSHGSWEAGLPNWPLTQADSRAMPYLCHLHGWVCCAWNSLPMNTDLFNLYFTKHSWRQAWWAFVLFCFGQTFPTQRLPSRAHKLQWWTLCRIQGYYTLDCLSLDFMS